MRRICQLELTLFSFQNRAKFNQIYFYIVFFKRMVTYSFRSSKIIFNKKVLLRERKRHTARRVVSTPSVVLPGYPPQAGGVPDLGTPLGGVPDPGTPPGGVPGPGYPPGGYLTRVPPPGGYLTWVPPPGGVPDTGTPPGGVPDRTPPSPLWTDKHL